MRISTIRAVVRAGLLLALIALTPFLAFRDSGPISASAAAQQPYGSCAAPATAGINVCEPGEPNPSAWLTDSPFQVIAAATSGTGQISLMELWADGKKVTQTASNPFDVPVNLGSGTHTLTMVAVDTTGAVLKSAPFQVSVQNSGGSGDNGCSAPGAPGVHVCAPEAGGCNTQPWVDIDATGRGESGTVDRMELWVEGTKVANFSGDQIYTSLIMVYGTVKVVEVDSKGNSKSTSLFFNGPC